MKLLTLSLVSVALAMPVAATASPSWQDVSQQTAARVIDSAPAVTSGVAVRAYPVPVQPSRAAGTPKFFANFVAAGIAINGVPCFGCVSGAPSALGLPDPFNYVPSNAVMQYNIAWTNLTFVGTCTVFFTITSGTQTVDKFSFKVPGISGAGGFDIGINRNRPTFSGKAVLSGKVKCLKLSSSVSADLIFQ